MLLRLLLQLHRQLEKRAVLEDQIVLEVVSIRGRDLRVIFLLDDVAAVQFRSCLHPR